MSLSNINHMISNSMRSAILHFFDLAEMICNNILKGS